MTAPHPLRPRETVVAATDYEGTVAFYRDVLGFEVTDTFSEGYHHTNLRTASGMKIGITPAAEVGIEPIDREANTVLMQVEVDDVPAFLEHVAAGGGSVQFGPSKSEGAGFWYGAFRDPEGNPIWVVDGTCP